MYNIAYDAFLEDTIDIGNKGTVAHLCVIEFMYNYA